MIEVVMPEMGESVAEGTVTRWLVQVGDSVDKDQPLVEVSTDKVDAEIPSPAAGTLREIRAAEGVVVQVDEVLAVIATVGDGAVDGAAGSSAATAGETASGAAPRSARPGAGAAREGAAPLPSADRGPAEGEVPEVEGELVSPGRDAGAAQPSPLAGPGEATAVGGRTLATPVARKIAAAEGVALERVRGTGAQGRITKDDVMQAIAERERAPATAPEPRPRAAAAPAGAPAPAGEHRVRPWIPGERVEIEPMSRMRKLTARHMTHSQATSVHVTTLFHIDMTRVVDTRDRVKRAFAREHGTKLTYMPFIFRALATALRAHPKFNAAIDGENIVYKKDVNLGMAVALDWGLIVPVIHDADQASLAGLAKQANDLAERARAKRLKPDEIQRGTFTVTNPGVYGSLFGTPIINQPQVAILCVGAIEKRPVVVTGEDGHDSIAIRQMAYFALTYDHRLIDGADAEMFMRDVKLTLETEGWSELAGLDGGRG